MSPVCLLSACVDIIRYSTMGLSNILHGCQKLGIKHKLLFGSILQQVTTN